LSVSTTWVDVPFAPRRWPFFYGWVVVGASTVGILASIPGQTMGVGVFTDDLLDALGLSRITLSTAYMFATLTSGLILPFAGSVLDRIGTRAAVVLSSFGLAAGLAIMALSETLTRIGGDLRPWLALGVVFVCFLTVRFFGQGCLTMASRVAIGKWFDHRRGLATAISSVFVSFGFNASPQLLNWMVERLGWQPAALLLAAILAGGMSLAGWVFYRDNPEDCGLVMDGVTDPAWHARMAARVPEVRKEYTRPEAARTWAFWLFAIGTGSQALVITAIAFHIASLGEQLGLSRTASYGVFLPMSFYGVPANFISGWASDRVKLKWLLIVMMAAQAVASTGLLFFSDPIGWQLLVLGGGVSGGLFATVVTVTWPRFFGRLHLGAISGLHMSIMVVASALGPVLFAYGYRVTHSYNAVIVVCWVMPVLMLLGCPLAENPQDRLRAARRS
jgi:OFA family oxalate/formate antiporter-like MFS transporter